MKKKPSLLPFESRTQPLLPRSAFARRLAITFAVALLLIAFSLFIGMLGYHLLEGFPWIDAFADASMILSGMGPLKPPQTSAGKLFAGLYALYSGLALILCAGLMLAPIIHRVLHRFHIDPDTRK